MKHNYWIYLLIMFGVTYLTRVAPLVIFRKKIQSRFIRSFLYYIPYAVLAAMTFPAVFFAAGSVPAAAAGVAAAVIAALMGGSLFTVAVTASAVV
jgi:branched-subunit amino acid transport protein